MKKTRSTAVIVSEIKKTSCKNWCELQAQVRRDTAKRSFLLRYCFPRSYEQFVRPDNGDPFLAALLLPAMKSHESLEVPAPVSRRLLLAANKIQALYRSWDKSLSTVRISMRVREEEPLLTLPPARRALFFSCGVDSYYSLFKNVTDHPNDEGTITDLIVVRGFDNPFDARDSSPFGTVLANARTVSNELQKKTLPVTTNLRNLGMQFVPWDCLYHGAAMASVGLALQNAFQGIYIASTFSRNQLRPWGSHPDLDPLWSTERLSFFHDGCDAGRLDKIRFIVQFPVVLETLRVCQLRPFPGNVYNCGLCEKCLRTMVGLYIAGVLHRCRTFPHSIDVQVLRTIRVHEEIGDWTETSWNQLVNELGSSRMDLAIKSALQEALPLSTAGKSIRRYRSPFFSLMPHAPPMLRLWVQLWRALRRSPPNSIFDLLGLLR